MAAVDSTYRKNLEGRHNIAPRRVALILAVIFVFQIVLVLMLCWKQAHSW